MLKIFTPQETKPSAYNDLTLFYSVMHSQKRLTSADLDKINQLGLSLNIPSSSIKSCLIDQELHSLSLREKDWIVKTCVDLYPHSYKFCIQVANSIGLNVNHVDRAMFARFKKDQAKKQKTLPMN